MLKALKASIAVALSLSCIWPVAAWGAVEQLSDARSFAERTDAGLANGAPSLQDESLLPEDTATSEGQPSDVDGSEADAPESIEATEGDSASQLDTISDSGSEESLTALAVARNGWVNEGGKTYFYSNGSMVKGWLVTNLRPTGGTGGLERYWLNPSTGELTKGLIDAGNGWWAFGKPDGSVVRGKYVNGSNSYHYFADNDGRLWSPGWHVTGQFTGGELQRYYIDTNAHAAVPGTSGDGWWHYTRVDGGFVVRGKYVGSKSYHYFADNDGRLWSPGWHVTGQFTGGELQRYYIDANAHAAVPGTSSDGWRHYTRMDGGFVARGQLNLPDGRVMFADNDGKLPNPGWNVTSAFGQGLQRYYIDGGGATRVGFFRVDGNAYYGYPDVGYVLRGKAHISGNGWTQVFLADNDGKLADFEGWLVTGKYDGGSLQRYRLDSAVAPGFYGAHLGHFTLGGHGYYGREDQGYVVRGSYRAPNGSMWYADNDGRLDSVNTTNDPELNGILGTIIRERGRDLRSLFNYVASYRYIDGSKYPTGNWSVPFAKEMYKNGGGNCYRYAALFCELARAAGYNANVVSGYVPSRSQGWAPHGWVEIHMNGTTYVCDPDMVHAYPGMNWYMFTYGNAPLNYRH